MFLILSGDCELCTRLEDVRDRPPGIEVQVIPAASGEPAQVQCRIAYSNSGGTPLIRIVVEKARDTARRNRGAHEWALWA